MGFEFSTSGKILFGEGKRTEALEIAPRFGSRGFIVTGGTVSRGEWLRRGLAQRGVECCFASFPREPQVPEIEAAVLEARRFRAEFVIGIGGGSAIDAGKAVSALVTNQGSITDYLEVIGGARPIREKPLPYLAMPTTAGTGAEVTRNAVLASPEHQVKVSLRGDLMLPPVAIVDPELTYDLPRHITAATGMDALTQLIEPFLCGRANPLVDSLCREGMRQVAASFGRACEEPGDRLARRGMALASLFGGLSLANAGLGVVHGFAGPLGGMFSAPHGAICAAILPHAMRVNHRAVSREEDSGKAARFREIAQMLTGDSEADTEAGILWVERLGRALEIPSLSKWGVTGEHIALVCERAEKSSSMKANPVKLSREELEEIIRAAL